MKILLTGGTGFIGSYVAVELARRGHAVTILARDPSKVPALEAIAGIEIAAGDLRDRGSLERGVAGKEAVVHLALSYSKSRGWEVLEDDTLPSVFLADAAAAAGVEEFLYTSSTAVNDSLYTGDRDPQEASLRTVTASTRQHPATYYGATKAATESYLLAASHLSPMRVNVIRPGYVFGNPVVPGACTQADGRFRAIVDCALAGRAIAVVKNDGTQFIWAGHLALLYAAILGCGSTRRTYFGLSKGFVSWEAIAREAVLRCGSRSEVAVEDRGWVKDGLLWDVSDMERDFGLVFDPWPQLREHLDHCALTARR
jgi:UDP-glucose 4-epimerase